MSKSMHLQYLSLLNLPHVDDGSNAVALVQVGEGRVDVLEGLGVGDEVVNLERAVLVSLDNLGQLRSALDTAKGRALPHSAGDELERSGGNLLASSSNADDDRLTPALMAGLQSLSHDSHVSGTVKGEVATSVGHLHQLVNNSGALGQLGGVDKVSGTKLVSPSLLVAIDVNDNDLGGSSLLGAHHDGQTDTASAEDSNIVALLDIGGDGGSSVAGGDTAAEQTGSVLGSRGVDGDEGDVSNHSVLGEGRAAHIRIEILALALEPGGSVWQNTLTLGGSHLLAQVGLAGLAELALLALGSVEWDDVVADLDVCHAFSDRLDNTAAFVSEDDGKGSFGIIAGKCEGIARHKQSAPLRSPPRVGTGTTHVWQIPVLMRSAPTSGHKRCYSLEDLDSHLVLLRRSHLDVFDHQRLGCERQRPFQLKLHAASYRRGKRTYQPPRRWRLYM